MKKKYKRKNTYEEEGIKKMKSLQQSIFLGWSFPIPLTLSFIFGEKPGNNQVWPNAE